MALNINQATGAKVRSLRKEKGMTLEQVSGNMGISLHHLAQLERGEKRWVLERLHHACEALQIPLYQLFQEDVVT